MVAAISLLPLSQAALGEVTISGWINEGVQFYDDGVSNDAVQSSDNGTTLGSRITFSGSNEVAPGLTAGFEVIVEPQTGNTPLITANQSSFGDTTGKATGLGVLGSSLNIGGAWGKVTAGLQSMPTDNIAVLEDPSLTLWSGISPVFRGNGFTIMNENGESAGTVWGDYLNCLGTPGLQIGIDCNGIYRNGIRYDLPAFGPVTVAVGYANDDIFDVSAKWKGDFDHFKASLALGYAVNQGVNSDFESRKAVAAQAAVPAKAAVIGTGTVRNPEFPAVEGKDAVAEVKAVAASGNVAHNEAENFQIQAGIIHPVTGVFGSIAYQHEEANLTGSAVAFNANSNGGGTISDDSDAWWLKVGVKRQYFSVGDTSVSFDYGQYTDQYGVSQANAGVTGSEVERIGVSIDQYFGSNLIIYGKWEQLDLGMAIGKGVSDDSTLYTSTEELETFTLGATYFF